MCESSCTPFFSQRGRMPCSAVCTMLAIGTSSDLRGRLVIKRNISCESFSKPSSCLRRRSANSLDWSAAIRSSHKWEEYKRAVAKGVRNWCAMLAAILPMAARRFSCCDCWCKWILALMSWICTMLRLPSSMRTNCTVRRPAGLSIKYSPGAIDACQSLGSVSACPITIWGKKLSTDGLCNEIKLFSRRTTPAGIALSKIPKRWLESYSSWVSWLIFSCKFACCDSSFLDSS